MKKVDDKNIDYVNKTPKELSDLLRYHTAEGNLHFVVKISSYDCDLNSKNPNGDTPLHIAVSKKFLKITRILLVMGANPNILNKKGETPLHIAANFKDNDFIKTLAIGGASRCSTSTVGCKVGCINKSQLREFDGDVSTINAFKKLENIENQEYKLLNKKRQDEIYKKMMEALKKRNNNNTKNYINVLSLDGGGIRGLVSLQILSEIEKMIGEPLFQYFDWVIGTSTGAIITAALTIGKSIRDCQKLYLRFKDDVFSGSISSPRSRTEALINFLQKEIGETCLSDIPWPRLMFTSFKIDEPSGHRLKLIRNYKLYSSKNEENLQLVKVLQMSSAAPTYFEAVDKIHREKPEIEKVRIGCAISIGTGIGPNDEPLKKLYFNGNRITNIPSYIDLAKLAIDQATASEGKTTEHAFARCSELGVPLFRFNPSFSRNVPLDTTNDSLLAEMMWECFVYAKMNQEQIKKMALLLKENGPSFNRKHFFKKVQEQSISVLPVSDYFDSMKSNDPDIKLLALKKIRESLSNRSRCDEIVTCGMVPTLWQCLKYQNTSIQYEAVSVLNIVTTKRNRVLSGDMIPLFINLLSSDDANVRDQAMYTIERAVQCASNCKTCFNLGIISVINKISLTETSDAFSLSATRIMYYIARNMPEILSQQLAHKMIQIQSKLTLQAGTDTVTYIYLLFYHFAKACLFETMPFEDVELVCKILYDIIADDNFQIEHKALAFDCLLEIAYVSKIKIEASLVENFIPLLNKFPGEIKFKKREIFLQQCTIEFDVSSAMGTLFIVYHRYLKDNDNKIKDKTLSQMNAILTEFCSASKEFKKEVYEHLNERGEIEIIRKYQNNLNTEIAQFSAKLISAFENI
uniref:phospholipase A2 n=1 Tax=Panagrolaimus davidi TaxID=227884 RepID=A0A914Q0J2_9BILA